MLDKSINFSHTTYQIINDKNEFLSLRKARNFFSIKDLIKSCDIESTVLLKRDTWIK